MAENSDQEKTEEATDQRREDFRRRGQVAQTRELSSVFLLFGMAITFWMMGRFFLSQTYSMYELVYGFIQPSVLGKSVIGPLFTMLGIKASYILLPIFLMVAVLTIFSSVSQVGFLYSEEALTPSFDKLNPISGLGKIFSFKSLAEGIKSILKFSVIGASAFFTLRGELSNLPKVVYYSASQSFAYLAQLSFELILVTASMMLIIAVIDFAYQKYNMEEQMKMSKQEIKDEAKTREGDPLIKARIRKIQKEMSQKRMMAEVPKADVIITNPTHIACALKYDPEKGAAPILLAKGQGSIAAKIREIAKDSRVPIVENKPLARTMYKTLEIGQTIPRELFAAVAEVLAYVFRMKKKGMV